jgi:ribonuclease HII
MATRAPAPSLRREAALWAEERVLIGVDEVGRGPLAGPVVAAAVLFPPRFCRVRGVRDSKELPAAKRRKLAERIRDRARAIGVGAASTKEIDRLNIRRATALAMRRAVYRACRIAGILDGPSDPLPPDVIILLDGLPMPELGMPHEALVDGDALCYSVAAAGVVAKTVRDELMCRLARRYPAYGWDSNMGYGTAEHREAIAASGATAHHRFSFEPVSQLSLDLSVI